MVVTLISCDPYDYLPRGFAKRTLNRYDKKDYLFYRSLSVCRGIDKGVMKNATEKMVSYFYLCDVDRYCRIGAVLNHSAASVRSLHAPAAHTQNDA